jgi:hypothetical protein
MHVSEIEHSLPLLGVKTVAAIVQLLLVVPVWFQVALSEVKVMMWHCVRRVETIPSNGFEHSRTVLYLDSVFLCSCALPA